MNDVSLKKDVMSIRIHPENRMRIDELAGRYGVPLSSVVNMCIQRSMFEIYDSDGYISSSGSLGACRSIRIDDGYFPLTVLSRAFGVNKDAMRMMVARGRVRAFRIGRELYLSYANINRIYGKDKRE